MMFFGQSNSLITKLDEYSKATNKITKIVGQYKIVISPVKILERQKQNFTKPKKARRREKRG